MKNIIASYIPELTALRQDLHQHPELGFEEVRTSGVVAREMDRYGLKVYTGWPRTGVVAVLTRGKSSKTLALRADMDALPVKERSDRKYRSVNDGVMHACGHDGHMAMLVGAARYLAENGDFDGNAVFVFQPAEEGGGGGRLMVEEGLIERFGIQAVYGMHNLSGLESGAIATRTGPIMAATDNFEITVLGEGTHAALPHTGIDPIIAASELVTTLQTAVAREIEALDSVVLSVTQFTSGTAYNIIPDEAVIRGCTRYRSSDTGSTLKEIMERMTAGVCAAHKARYIFRYMPGYPPVVNTENETRAAVQAAVQAAGKEKVDENCPPLMASEDFSYFLEKVPGCYVFLGNGTHTDSHSSHFDFNDEVLSVGVAFWVSLVEQELKSQGSSEFRV